MDDELDRAHKASVGASRSVGGMNVPEIRVFLIARGYRVASNMTRARLEQMLVEFLNAPAALEPSPVASAYGAIADPLANINIGSSPDPLTLGQSNAAGQESDDENDWYLEQAIQASLESQRQQHGQRSELQDRRQIIDEQDKLYQQSLEADRRKAQQRTERQRREKKQDQEKQKRESLSRRQRAEMFSARKPITDSELLEMKRRADEKIMKQQQERQLKQKSQKQETERKRRERRMAALKRFQ